VQQTCADEDDVITSSVGVRNSPVNCNRREPRPIRTPAHAHFTCMNGSQMNKILNVTYIISLNTFLRFRTRPPLNQRRTTRVRAICDFESLTLTWWIWYMNLVLSSALDIWRLVYFWKMYLSAKNKFSRSSISKIILWQCDIQTFRRHQKYYHAALRGGNKFRQTPSQFPGALIANKPYAGDTRTRNLHQIFDASFLYKLTWTSFLYKFLVRVSSALETAWWVRWLFKHIIAA